MTILFNFNSQKQTMTWGQLGIRDRKGGGYVLPDQRDQSAGRCREVGYSKGWLSRSAGLQTSNGQRGVSAFPAMALHTNDHTYALKSSPINSILYLWPNYDELVKSQKSRHSCASRSPDVVPAQAGNYTIYWIPVFTGNPGFPLSRE